MDRHFKALSIKALYQTPLGRTSTRAFDDVPKARHSLCSSKPGVEPTITLLHKLMATQVLPCVFQHVSLAFCCSGRVSCGNIQR